MIWHKRYGFLYCGFCLTSILGSILQDPESLRMLGQIPFDSEVTCQIDSPNKILITLNAWSFCSLRGKMIERKEYELWKQETPFESMLALNCVPWGKSLHHSEPQYPHL